MKWRRGGNSVPETGRLGIAWPAFTVLVLASVGLASAQLSREPGAIYLEDFLQPGQEVVLRVTHPAPIFYQSDGKRRLGTLVAGKDARVVAVTDKAYMVQALAEHAEVKGWITPKALESHNNADFVAVLKELFQRQQVVNELIAAQQVALGMTLREVKLSLGEPDRVSSMLDGTGRSDILEYITYERVPQLVTRLDPNGIPYRATVFVKVETGKVAIAFEDEVAKSIANQEGAPNLNAPVTIAPPPLLLF